VKCGRHGGIWPGRGTGGFRVVQPAPPRASLDEVANAAAFVASDLASSMTGTVANLTCGSVVE
jgi:enoyl-[acyl-carrier-protein] reductase (NADH)